ncbi:MAG: glycosyltransferase [Phycisphaerae bacterium]
MKILVLAHGLRFTGGKTVGLSVVDALARVAPQHEYLVTIPPHLGYEARVEKLPHGRALVCAAKNRMQRRNFDRVTLRHALQEFRPDVLFALSGQGMTAPGCPQALFPQDPHLFYPVKHYARDTLQNKIVKQYHQFKLGKHLRDTQLIFCQSPVVEERIRRKFGYNGAARIIYSAPSTEILTRRSDEGVPPEYKPYAEKTKLVYVSAYYGHKNVDAIADAFELFPDALGNVVAFVTVAPQQHVRAGRFIQRLESPAFAGRVINLGQVPHERIGDYYAAADGLLMPTLLETFGLPYVEAMSFGLPILTSNLDFAHAVCGDAAIYFDPWSPASLRDAIVRFRDDGMLRKELAEKSRARLPQLANSWDDITRTMVDELEKLA